MSDQATNPFDERVDISKEDMDPAIIIYETSSVLSIAGKPVADGILFKSDFSAALSESNKRYLEEHFGVMTDYVEDSHVLWEKYGIPEEKRGTVMLLKEVELLPLDFFVTGYEKASGKNEKLLEPKVIFVSGEGKNVSRKEAIDILADWFHENDYICDLYDEMMDCETMEQAFEVGGISPEDVLYAEQFECKDELEMLDFASLHSLAAQYIDDITIVSGFIYTVLAKKYEEAGVLLADTKFVFGFDDEEEIVLHGEVGSPDDSTLVSKILYEKTGKLVDMLETPVAEYIKHLENVGEDAEIPEYVLDEVSDTCMYLAESLCDDIFWNCIYKE